MSHTQQHHAKSLERALGFSANGDGHARQETLRRCIHLQLLAMGIPTASPRADASVMDVTRGLLASYRQKSRLLEEYRCPADQRIEAFLNAHFADLKLDAPLRLPGDTFILDQHGVARELSLPQGADEYESPLLKSYRVRNGVLHNPRSDRRTTKGTFHVAEGGLPVPADKIAVPRNVFAELFRRSVNPPQDLLTLPFTAKQSRPAEVFCSLLLRPLVCPAIPGRSPARTMEVRFFAPGSLVSNLDFVESIFGNAGDPMLPEHDAALDVLHWTGHTGCVILAPHLCGLSKKELGLPHVDAATPRQRRDGQCWKSEDEAYNDGQAFKVTCRDETGVIVTLIADNYYGYCKKEVKTQISYATNLMGNAEEEHAGGALVFPSYNVGDAYIPEDATLTLRTQTVSWTEDGQPRSLPLLCDHYYVTPWGSKIHVDKHPASGRFRLIVTVGEGIFCHKPCTVSGGGKSEISKSLHDYMIYGPVYVNDLQKDLDAVEEILKKDHGLRWAAGKAPQDYAKKSARPILGPERTLGSVVKLLTPSPDYTEEYNGWLESLPSHIVSLVLLIKRLYKPEWGNDWRRHFTVDTINGEAGHELKVDDMKAGGSYLRVGFDPSDAWKTYRLRQDFYPAMKVQAEDDISASTVVPAGWLEGLGLPSKTRMEDGGWKMEEEGLAPSLKLVQNCEYRLFQRPDDAIHPGFDKQAEADIGRSDNFLSNYEPLTPAQATAIVQRIADFDRYTPPMKQMILDGARQQGGFVSISSHPRLVDGKPTKNPRYLQNRLDLMQPVNKHLAEIGLRLARGIAADKPVVTPVDAVLFGRRNNPPDHKAGVRSLAVFNPIHYQELPELFMDFICSLTGKSPSTTGAGSEGALTKGPFNALMPTADLNAALVSFILTGLAGFSTAAGHVGPEGRVDHDLSLMIPELWCRLRPEERDPAHMIKEGHLKQLEDYEYQGKRIPASRLGYRITYGFVRTYFGRIFANPNRVLDRAILEPEFGHEADFADGVLNIAEAHQRVARQYFEDGSVEQACPPLRALLHVMANGTYEGRTVHDPKIRAMFTREALLGSDWYAQRLRTKQQRDRALWEGQVKYLSAFIADESHAEETARLHLKDRLAHARAELARVEGPDYVKTLFGTIGADPMRPVG